MGEATGYRHWQLLVVLSRKGSVRTMQGLFEKSGQAGHYELSRSDAAERYVWKDETAVAGTRFEVGQRPFNRNSASDWDRIWELSVEGKLLEIPSQIRVQHFGNICRIGTRFARGVGMDRAAFAYWGPSGTGKSRRAWAEAGVQAYPKDPRTKWWDGYTGQEHVVIDEFRGGIDIAHLLRWLDRYPVLVETKGGSVPLRATTFWITSNLSPEQWYPELDGDTFAALSRRINTTHFVQLC